jgi:Protein of unknown function (DUF429)
MAGIDVGEDFLDIATFLPASRRLKLARVDLRKLSATAVDHPRRSQFKPDPILSLRAMLVDRVPELRGAIALVDSPRWPSDLYCSKLIARANDSVRCLDNRTSLPEAQKPRDLAGTSSVRSRKIDAALRALVIALRELGTDSVRTPLSMFPTPPLRYFGAHLNSATCKAHLRLLGQILFGRVLNREYGPVSGGLFTRFMIVGFATYIALQPITSRVYECYPDLQFKLWSRGQQCLSKNSSIGRTAALASRIDILMAVAAAMGISDLPAIQRMDEADAAILALSAAAARQQRTSLIVESPEEGRFLVALTESDAQRLRSDRWSISNHTAVDPYLISLKSDAAFAPSRDRALKPSRGKARRKRRRLTHA